VGYIEGLTQNGAKCTFGSFEKNAFKVLNPLPK
jgi:hypothetical protein